MTYDRFVSPPHLVEDGFLIPKLRLLEIWPLYPFVGDRGDLTVLDVGGNIGLWCQAWMQTFGSLTAVYHAFEPLPGNVEVFKGRLQQGRVSRFEKVRLHNTCVGHEDGEVTLKTHANVSSTASVLLDSIQVGSTLVQNDKHHSCKQIRVDTFLEENGIAHVDLMKVDVEGYEWNVLQGARESISGGRIGAIYFEFGQHQGELGQSFRMFWDFLQSHGFYVYRTYHYRNFFGLQQIHEYHESLENFGYVWMILASAVSHKQALNRPLVIGRYKPPA